MYKLYSSGILVGTFENKTSNILDVFSNKFIRSDGENPDELFITRYKIAPTYWLKRIEELQNYISSADTEFVSEDGEVFQKNGVIWCGRNKINPVDIITLNGLVIGFISASRDLVSILISDGYEDRTPLKNFEKLNDHIFAVEEKGTFMVEMYDKIRLSTRVYIPRGQNPSPVILLRTPYGKDRYTDNLLPFVQRGYAVVLQDTRGREESEGEWIPCKFEKDDGDATLTWIGESDFCNGDIGMIGSSYSGCVQWAAATSGNPYLKCLVSIVTSGSPFIDLPYKGGCLMSGTLAWAFAMSGREIDPSKMMREDWDELLSQRPIASIVENGLGEKVPFWDLWCENDTNNDFWQSQSWYDQSDDMRDIAVMVVSGWYDDDNMGTSEAIDLINEKKFSQYRIILGPWLHQGNNTRDINDIPLGINAIRYDLDYQYFNWFEEHLKQKSKGAVRDVEYYNMGTMEWKKAETWPPDVKRTSFFFSTDMNASGEYTDYTFNPNDPAPHIIDVSSNEASPPGDYQEIEKRDDVITFTGNELPEELSISGDALFDFYASSDCVDTDWVVRINDVSPDGRSIKIAENILRAKFREGFKEPILLTKNTIYRYKIRLSKTANTFLKGHKIRIMITSGAAGYIFPNPNTGNNPAFELKLKTAHQKIFHSEEYPSRIILPVVVDS